jgi:hypothetical protein
MSKGADEHGLDDVTRKQWTVFTGPAREGSNIMVMATPECEVRAIMPILRAAIATQKSRELRSDGGYSLLRRVERGLHTISDVDSEVGRMFT